MGMGPTRNKTHKRDVMDPARCLPDGHDELELDAVSKTLAVTPPKIGFQKQEKDRQCKI